MRLGNDYNNECPAYVSWKQILGFFFCLGVLCSVIAWIALIRMNHEGRAQDARIAKADAAVAAVGILQPSSVSPLPGHEGTVQIDGADWVPLARTRGVLTDFIRATQIKDQHGLAQTLLGPQMFAVDRGTRVLVLERHTFVVKLRVLEGAAVGAAGWLPIEMVKMEG